MCSNARRWRAFLRDTLSVMKYLCDPHVLPAVMPGTFAELADFVAGASTYAQWIHLDVSDGAFAASVQWPLADAQQRAELDAIARKEAALPAGVLYEVHLMAKEPLDLGVAFARAGAARLMAHIEAFDTADAAREALSQWKAAGAQEVGVALLLGTPLTRIEAVADQCDFVQLMSIAEIGFQGRAFDDRALSRVEELHAMYPDMMVGVDGGVSEATVEELVRAGANRLVVGGALTRGGKPAAIYARIHDRAMKGCAPLALSAA